MNKNDRRKLKAAARKYCSISMQALKEFTSITDDLKAREQEKLENLPESLRDSSSQGINIAEAVDQIDEMQEYFENVEEACTTIADMTGVDIVYRESTGSVCVSDDDPRRNRVQILITDYMLILLRLRAAAEGCSHNELICRALLNELLKDPPRQ